MNQLGNKQRALMALVRSACTEGIELMVVCLTRSTHSDLSMAIYSFWKRTSVQKYLYHTQTDAREFKHLDPMNRRNLISTVPQVLQNVPEVPYTRWQASQFN